MLIYLLNIDFIFILLSKFMVIIYFINISGFITLFR